MKRFKFQLKSREFLLFAILTVLFHFGGLAQKNCLDSAQLIVLDALWEKSLLESDAQQIESMTADAFIWVHNHASLVDSKSSLLDRARDVEEGAAGKLKSRTSFDLSAIKLGNTGIVTGHTIVERATSKTNYHFMRTYVKIKGQCYLLANHTMAIPAEED